MVDCGSTVIKYINNSNLKDVKVKAFGYEDRFIEHGKVDELEEKYGLDVKSIIKYIKK